MALVLLPGERVEARLRPSPWSRLGGYAPAALLLVLALLLRLLFTSDAWALHEAGPPLRFWEHLWGNAVIAYIIAALLATPVLALLVRGTWRTRLMWAGAAAVALVLVAALWWRAYPWALPALLIATAVVALGALEADRMTRAITFTNLRVAVSGGLWDKEEGYARYEDIADIDTEQDALGRLLDLGALHPVPAGHARDEPMPRVAGLRPLSQGRALLAAMVQHATASAELKRAGDTESRLYRALQAFGHAPARPLRGPPEDRPTDPANDDGPDA